MTHYILRQCGNPQLNDSHTIEPREVNCIDCLGKSIQYTLEQSLKLLMEAQEWADILRKANK